MEQMLTYTFRYSSRHKNCPFWVVQKSIRCTLLEIGYALRIELLFNGGVVNTCMKLCVYEIVWKQQVLYMLYVHKFVMLMCPNLDKMNILHYWGICLNTNQRSSIALCECNKMKPIWQLVCKMAHLNNLNERFHGVLEVYAQINLICSNAEHIWASSKNKTVDVGVIVLNVT